MSYVPTWERNAEQKGREAGLKEGVALGKKEGVALGKKEGVRSRNIEIAMKLLRKGIAIDIISETTGLSHEEIEALAIEQ